jgi:hypothetical protein
MLVELTALRLAIFGWSLVLFWLCGKRIREYYSGVALHQSPRPIDGAALVTFAITLAVSNIVGYFAPAINSILFGEFDSRYPYTNALAMVGMLICLATLIDRMSYSRRYKILWEIGWLVFVHVMIWGRQWTIG